MQELKINPQNPDFVSKKSQPLGIYTNFDATPINKGLEGDSFRRAEKYVLQNTVIKLLPKERVRGCLRYRISSSDDVEVRYNSTREKAHYSNVQRCGSVWVCPVCSAQISEGRRQELKQAIKHHTATGGSVYLVTLTNPHYISDDLQGQLSSQKKALKHFMGDRKPREFLKGLGKVGHIRAMEVTYGSNGWHPHYHILYFFESPFLGGSIVLQNELGAIWQKCCVKAGLKKPSLEHGCDVRDGSYAQEYVSKWGLEDEVTKGHIKKGRKGSLTPWDLLRLAESGDDKAGKLFHVFAKSFKGKAQLRWSKGLKSLLLIEDKTDEELATETDKDSVQVNTIDIKIWKIILSCKLRSKYLECIEYDIKHDADTASDLIIQYVPVYLEKHPEELERFAETMELKNRVAELTEMSTD